jgi:hypothetical protein
VSGAVSAALGTLFTLRLVRRVFIRKILVSFFDLQPRCFPSQPSNSALPQQNRTYLPNRMHGIRCSLGVRARVWLRIQDSGTLQRAANSAESINSAPIPALRDINETSVVSGCMFSVT